MVLKRKGHTMNRKGLSMIAAAMISMASMNVPVPAARSVGLMLTIAAVALDTKPVAAEKCAKLMARSKALGIGCFAAGYGYRGAIEIVKALGLHHVAKEIEETVRGVPAAAPEINGGNQAPASNDDR
jgi:hypothetical protein